MLRERAQHLVERRTWSTWSGGRPPWRSTRTPEHLAQLEALQGEAWEFGQVFPALIASSPRVVRIATTRTAAGSVHPAPAGAAAVRAPALLLSAKTSGLFYARQRAGAVPARRSEHLLELTATAGAAKEIRLFRLGDELLARFHASHREIQRIHRRDQRTRPGAIGLPPGCCS